MSEVIMEASISVVIPTHNRPEGLVRSLDSILNQTVMPEQVVIVDDGSTPSVSVDVFAAFPDSVRCTLLRNEKPQGGNNARNKGIIAAEGKYVAFLDDDDQFKPEKVEVLKHEISLNLGFDVFYHSAHIHMLNEGVSYYSKICRFDEKELFRALLVQNRIGGTPMVTVRKKALIDVGLFDEEMPALQDYELWLRLAKNGFRFFFIETALTDYYYETKKSSVSKSIDVNEVAIGLIEKKFSEDYKLLSRSEKKEYECWKRRKLVHKSLLNGRCFKALRYQFYLLMFSPSFANFIPLLVIPLGPKMVFKLKAKAG